MKKTVLLFALISSCFTLLAQKDWQLINSGIFEELNCVTISPNAEIFIGGDNGNIYRSDTSLNLVSVTPNLMDGVADILFIPASEAWAVGDDGLILNSTDSGSTWTNVSSGVGSNLESIFFVDANTAYIAGRDGTILKSTDAGATWSAQSSGTTNRLESVVFSTSQRGFVAGRDGSFLETTDGGTTWTNVNLGGDDNKDVLFLSTDTGFVAGENGIFKTTDGGNNWNMVGSAGGIEVNALHFAGNKAYAVGEKGEIFISTDRGDTWQPDTMFSSMANLEFSDVWLLDANNAIAVGEAGSIAVQFSAGSIPVGLEETSAKTLEFYPNPARDHIELQLPNRGQEALVRIYASSGKLAQSNTLIGDNTLDISDLKQGIYIIQMEQEDAGVFQNRLVIQE